DSARADLRLRPVSRRGDGWSAYPGGHAEVLGHRRPLDISRHTRIDRTARRARVSGRRWTVLAQEIRPGILLVRAGAARGRFIAPDGRADIRCNARNLC